MQFGVELAALGNAFVSCEPIFTRDLLCPTEGCGWQMRLSKLRKDVDYKWDGRNFTGVCERCGRQVKYIMKDNPAVDDQGRKVRFVFRDPADMLIQFNRLTGSYKYFYKMPDQIRSAIRGGDSVYLEDSPKVFIDAAVNGGVIEFPEDAFFHARTTTLSA